jgi:putative glutamine amidotransferase
MRTSPTIVVTVANPSRPADPEVAARKNALYAAAVARAGGHPVLLDSSADPAARSDAFESMDGLLLSGGADVDPARYGRTATGAIDLEPDRDALEVEAWAAATERGVPVLGICRGLQAINVFAGGTLIQHVEGHAGPSWGTGPAATHPIRPAPGSRLARILFPSTAGDGVLAVNSYHHQGIGAADLAPGLVATAWASGPDGDLVEALEAADGRFLIGVQCHPERTESTPAAFEHLFSAFVDEARGPAVRR